MDTPTDAELLEVYGSSRDEATFAQLMRRHGPLVYRICRRILGNAHEAEDAAQAVFVVLSRKAGELRRGDLSAWLSRVAHNMALEAVRKRMRRNQREQDYAVCEPSQTGAEPDETANPALLQVLDAALQALPARHREAVILRYLKNHSQQEAARLAGCSAPTLAKRASRGIEQLRKQLGNRGFATSVTAVTTLLTSEASSPLPETLISSALATVKSAAATSATTTATTGTVMKLANATLKAMFWAKIKTSAVVAIAIAAVGGIGIAAAFAANAGHQPPVAPTNPAIQTDPGAILVTPRGWDAYKTFARMAGQGAPRVATLGWHGLVVPTELRFHPVPARTLIETIAAKYDLKAHWSPDRTWVVLYPGAPDDEIEQVRKDLASSDVILRRDAAWRARWFLDVRTVPLLIKAAKDKENEIAWLAKTGLRKLGLSAVLMLDESAMDLLLTEKLNSTNAMVRTSALSALLETDIRILSPALEEKALAYIRDGLADTNTIVRNNVAALLQKVGGEKALPLVEKALADTNFHVRSASVLALDNLNGYLAQKLVENLLSIRDRLISCEAISALGNINGGKALPFIEKAFADPYAKMRAAAAKALGNVGGSHALELLEQALDDKDADVRDAAVEALGNIGGEKALALIEKWAESNQKYGFEHVKLCHAGCDKKVLAILGNSFANPAWSGFFPDPAATTLCSVNVEMALAFIDKALTNANADVRSRAASALSYMEGEKALALIEKALKDTNTNVRWNAALSLQNRGGTKALALIEQTLQDSYEPARNAAAEAFGAVGGPKTLAFIETTLASQDNDLHAKALRALIGVCGEMGGKYALPLIEKEFTNQDVKMRRDAALALYLLTNNEMKCDEIDREKLQSLIEKALNDPDDHVSYYAFSTLQFCKVDNSKVLPLIEKALNAPVGFNNYERRLAAAWALGYGSVTGEKTLPLIKKVLVDSDVHVRNAAQSALLKMDGEKALVLIEPALVNTNVAVRQNTVAILSSWPTDEEKVRNLLLEQLAREKDRNVFDAVCSALNEQCPGDLLVEKAIKETPVPPPTVQPPAPPALPANPPATKDEAVF